MSTELKSRELPTGRIALLAHYRSQTARGKARLTREGGGGASNESYRGSSIHQTCKPAERLLFRKLEGERVASFPSVIRLGRTSGELRTLASRIRGKIYFCSGVYPLLVRTHSLRR